MTPTSLPRDVNPEGSERGEASVLGQHLVEGRIAGPRSRLGGGGIDELGGNLRTGSVEELAVGNGGAVHVIDVTAGELRGALGASRGPDGNGGDGDDVIHREILPSGESSPLPSIGRGANVNVGRVPADGTSGAGRGSGGWRLRVADAEHI